MVRIHPQAEQLPGILQSSQLPFSSFRNRLKIADQRDEGSVGAVSKLRIVLPAPGPREENSRVDQSLRLAIGGRDGSAGDVVHDAANQGVKRESNRFLVSIRRELPKRSEIMRHNQSTMRTDRIENRGIRSGCSRYVQKCDAPVPPIHCDAIADMHKQPVSR
ncbi:MAG: hypothetical protein AB7E24_12430 [Novosphingobium sp.]